MTRKKCEKFLWVAWNSSAVIFKGILVLSYGSKQNASLTVAGNNKQWGKMFVRAVCVCLVHVTYIYGTDAFLRDHAYFHN